ncbi:MAG: hypothetical protein HDS35_06080 [Bacteroides sp.]|nr:hypothetical protein [Bacteroides sp.]
MKLFKYIVSAFLIASAFVSCSDNAGLERLPGADNDPLTIKAEFGKNLVGRVTVDGQPRQGVVVSDGVNVITTDAKGEYQMYTTGRQHVFISMPEDCELPTMNGLPKFYKTISFTDGAIIQRDFNLVSGQKKNEWTLFTMADPQIGNDADLTEFNGMLPRMAQFTSTLPGAVYGIDLGDIVWNKPDYFTVYAGAIRNVPVPVFSVIGNHDHNEGIKNDTESDKDFRDVLGPTYYSANIGDCHLVVLDDVLYRGETSRNDYSGTITDAQLEWLEKDLSYVDHDKTIIIGLHIPTARRNSSTHVSNNQALYDLVKDYRDVQILSGHSHNHYTTTIADNITETTFASVMGAFWYPLCNDGAPRGYGALEFKDGKLVNKYFVGDGCDRNYQMKLYAPEDAVLWNPSNNPGDPYDKILANIFCWHEDWTVETQEDGGAWTLLPAEARLIPSQNGGKCWDPDVRKCLVDGAIPANHGGAAPENNNDHMFLYTPQEGWKSVTFRATDSFGNVYTETLNAK